MNRMMLLLTALVISGCASIPSDLQTNTEQALLPFSATATNGPTGQNVRWGGEIAKIHNLQEGSLLEVVEFSLNSTGRPVKSDTSGGRFRILVSGFIDPAIYVPGRLVTALGNFSTTEDDKVGEQSYVFPVLHAQHLHLWPEVKESPTQQCNCDPFFLHRSLMMRPIIVVPADSKRSD
ncbi:Slp family lipoprotein [Nitrincola nitratireducens]|uniref:Outer membrane protein slp n=1 Tax=Nitrincola nitratireducens TaxID=1229521 RepID=W9UT34_9GAMM|nr:Slp family lipoprotein [Nitrincola nitratireducens]EXJ10264.1 Outer membrane protein slp precursor [Nitrincola nitratireducens]